MDSLARARQYCRRSEFLHQKYCRNGCEECKRIATAIDEVRLEEAKWQLANLIDPWAFSDSEVGKKARKHIRELAASLRERGKV